MNNSCEIFSRPNQEAKIHDLAQFTLWTPTPGRPNYRSRLTWGERNGAPRLTIYTNFEEGTKVLYVGMSPEIFYMFVEELSKIAKGPVGSKQSIENLDRLDKSADFSPTNSYVRNTLHFGKDQDGICWLGIEQKDCKNIRFVISSSEFHRFTIQTEEGQRKMTEAEFSARRTYAYARSLRDAMGNWISRIQPPYEKNKKKPTISDNGDGSEPTSLKSGDFPDINY